MRVQRHPDLQRSFRTAIVVTAGKSCLKKPDKSTGDLMGDQDFMLALLAAPL